MANEIIKILRAGECCEVISDKKWGKITVNHPLQHDFIKYPVSSEDPEAICCFCRSDYRTRLIVTVQGLAFAEIFSVFADEEIDLISLNETVSMHVLADNTVRVTITPHDFEPRYCKEHSDLLNLP